MSNIISLFYRRLLKQDSKYVRIKSKDEKIAEALEKFGSHKENVNNVVVKDDSKLEG